MQEAVGLNVKISDILFPQAQFANQNQEKTHLPSLVARDGGFLVLPDLLAEHQFFEKETSCDQSPRFANNAVLR